MSDFRIESNCWYASTAFGASLRTSSASGQNVSPVRVNRFTPLKTGDGLFEIEYIRPVLEAECSLQLLTMKTLHLDRSGLLAKQMDESDCLVYFTDLRSDWLGYHFPFVLPHGEETQLWLEQNYTRSPGDLADRLRSASKRHENLPPTTEHWGSDRFWQDAYRVLEEFRQHRLIALDVHELPNTLADGEPIAYKLMEAMCSVKEHESWEGYKGASRLLLLTLAMLWKQSQQSPD